MTNLWQVSHSEIPIKLDSPSARTYYSLKDHPDLNVVGGRRFYTITSGPPWERGSFDDDNYDDDNGHGSHVGGTAAAIDNGIGVVGVAPGARLWGVKVLNANGSGFVSDIVKGIDLIQV